MSLIECTCQECRAAFKTHPAANAPYGLLCEKCTLYRKLGIPHCIEISSVQIGKYPDGHRWAKWPESCSPDGCPKCRKAVADE